MNRALEKIVGVLLIENKLSLYYLLRVGQGCSTAKLFEIVLDRLHNSDIVMDSYMVSLAKVAIGEQELKSIPSVLQLHLTDLGLLESDGSWNPFVGCILHCLVEVLLILARKILTSKNGLSII